VLETFARQSNRLHFLIGGEGCEQVTLDARVELGDRACRIDRTQGQQRQCRVGHRIHLIGTGQQQQPPQWAGFGG
jgi:hypothetical protein